ncbi:SAM-dependent methlyltransferase, partial [Vibrio parahaemolyticus]
AHAAPAFGNTPHWAAGLPEKGRAARYAPERISAADPEAFHLRFLAQCAVPNAQMTTVGQVVHLIDVVRGSAASLTP